MRIGLFVFLVNVLQSVVGIVIHCDFSGYDWNYWGERYACNNAHPETDITEPNTSVKIITGKHKKARNNKKVEAVRFYGEHMSYLVQGLLNFFPNMDQLYVLKSNLEHIDRADFIDYTQLTTLSLSENKLSDIPYDAFDDLVEMEYFSLSWNRLKKIPNLKTLKKLKELYMFENQIEALTKQDLSGNKELEIIWFYNNKLKTIDHTIFSNLKKLRTAKFNRNSCININYDQHSAENFIEKVKQNCEPAGGRLLETAIRSALGGGFRPAGSIHVLALLEVVVILSNVHI